MGSSESKNARKEFVHAVVDHDWTAVRNLAKNNGLYPDELQTLAIGYNKVTKDTEAEETFEFVLRECNIERIQSLFQKLIELEKWRAVGVFLRIPKIDKQQRRVAVNKASKRASDDDLSNILHHCLDDQFDDAFNLAINRGLWDAVRRLMRRRKTTWLGGSTSRASEAQCQQALSAAVQRDAAGDVELTEIAMHCLSFNSLREMCLKHAVVRGLWEVVHKALKLEQQQMSDANKGLMSFIMYGAKRAVCRPARDTDGPSSTFYWVVEEVCQRADEKMMIENFLPFCTHPDLTEMALENLVKRKMWQASVLLLQQSAESQDMTDTEDNSEPLVPPPDVLGTEQQFNVIVKESLRRSMWLVLKALNQHGISKVLLKDVTKKATEEAQMLNLPLEKEDRGPQDRLQSLLNLLAKRSCSKSFITR